MTGFASSGSTGCAGATTSSSRRCAPGSTPATSPAARYAPPQAELLERFDVLRLQADDGSERKRIAAQIEDPWLREGIARYGLAEYVGGGYLAVQRFENARAEPHPHGHPLGVAMVRAGADWRRIGLDIIPTTSLAALAPMYLPERFRYDSQEDAATANAWATELVDATMSLLEPADDLGGTRAFDYIVDYISSGTGSAAADVPEHTWREAVASASAEHRLNLAYNAYFSGQLDYAEELWRQAADDPDRPAEGWRAVVNRGVLHEEQGRPEQTQADFRAVISAAQPDVAPAAAYNLGRLLLRQGLPEQAEAAYRQVISSAHPDMAPAATVDLGTLLLQRAQPEQAEAAYRQAISTAHPDEAPKAAYDLGVLLHEEGRLEQAEAAYRQAICSAHPEVAPRAAVDLVVLLQQQGRHEQAEAVYRGANGSAHPDRMSP